VKRREMAERIERLEAQVRQLRDDEITNLAREAETLDLMMRVAERRPAITLDGRTINRAVTVERRRARRSGT
jgi:hypothetical protein